MIRTVFRHGGVFALACASTTVRTQNTSPAVEQRRDSVATAVIPPTGGSVVLKGFVTVNFPAGAFAVSQPVTVAAKHSQEMRERFAVAAADPQVPPLRHQIYITTGRVQPAADCEVAITLPQGFLDSIPPGHVPSVWALELTGGPMEHLDEFEPFPSVYDPATKVVRAKLPRQVFDDGRRADGLYEAVLMIGSVPE